MKGLLLLAIPVAEIILSIWLGSKIGGWMLLLWFVMAFFVGRQLMRGATQVLMPQMAKMQSGQTADMSSDLLAAVCTALAGFLFILPGVITDGMGLLLLLPPVQALMRGQLSAAMKGRGQGFMMMGGFGGQPPFGGQSPFGQGGPFGQGSPFGQDNSQVFDGEAREVKPDTEVRRIDRKDL